MNLDGQAHDGKGPSDVARIALGNDAASPQTLRNSLLDVIGLCAVPPGRKAILA